MEKSGTLQFFFLFEKNMSLMSINLLSFGGIFVLVHDCVAWSKVFKDEVL